MNETKCDSYIFIGPRAVDSARFYEVISSQSERHDKDYLAWDAAHKFGSGFIGPNCASFCHGLIYGEKAKEASQYYDQKWKEAFQKCPKMRRQSAMRMVSHSLVSDVEKMFEVTISVIDGYYY